MNSTRLKWFFCILIAELTLACAVHATPTERFALVIGNGNYQAAPLNNPVNDADDMAATLKRLGFSVIVKKNATLQGMEEAIREFGEQLKRGRIGLFFYAGHGVQISGKNYLIPVGATIRKETDAKYHAVDTEMIIDEMANAGSSVNIVILDACRDNPFGRSFRSASRGLAVISSAPKGTLITYSTSPGKVASDGSGRNSPYTSSLVKFMQMADLPVEDVFKRVRKELVQKTGGQQIPWELSSLEGDFVFKSSKSVKTSPVLANNTTTKQDDLGTEQQRIEEEKKQLQKERELLEQKKALLDEQRRLEKERKSLEEAKQKLAHEPLAVAGFIRRINAKVTGVKFFETPYDTVPKDQRIYTRNFMTNRSRFISWEVLLEHPAAGRRVDFPIDAVWYDTNGSIMTRQTRNAYIEAHWTTSWQTLSYGWREFGTNTWKPGTYRVDLFVDGDKIASESFTMY